MSRYGLRDAVEMRGVIERHNEAKVKVENLVLSRIKIAVRDILSSEYHTVATAIDSRLITADKVVKFFKAEFLEQLQ